MNEIIVVLEIGYRTNLPSILFPSENCCSDLAHDWTSILIWELKFLFYHGDPLPLSRESSN